MRLICTHRKGTVSTVPSECSSIAASAAEANAPQGLKPRIFRLPSGTTKVVPFRLSGEVWQRKLIAIATALIFSALPALAQVVSQEPHRISSPISFIEDADVAAPGVLSVSHDFDFAQVRGGRDIAFPSGYVSLGVARRFEISGGLGYARSQFETIHVNGLSDIYIGGKVVVLPQKGRRPAFAVKPTLEVLGTASTSKNLLAPGRVNVLVPLSIQRSFEQFRVYYTVGYLSRGIFFQSAAYELNHWSRVTPSVVVSHSRLTHELRLVSEFGLNRSRSDVLGNLSVSLTPMWSVYGSVGRSFGRADLNSTRYQFSGGVSFNFRLWGVE